MLSPLLLLRDDNHIFGSGIRLDLLRGRCGALPNGRWIVKLVLPIFPFRSMNTRPEVGFHHIEHAELCRYSTDP